MKKHLLLIFILSILSICSYAQDATFSTAGAYNITIPPGVTTIRVDAFGGGGGGGGSNTSEQQEVPRELQVQVVNHFLLIIQLFVLAVVLVVLPEVEELQVLVVQVLPEQ